MNPETPSAPTAPKKNTYGKHGSERDHRKSWRTLSVGGRLIEEIAAGLKPRTSRQRRRLGARDERHAFVKGHQKAGIADSKTARFVLGEVRRVVVDSGPIEIHHVGGRVGDHRAVRWALDLLVEREQIACKDGLYRAAVAV